MRRLYRELKRIRLEQRELGFKELVPPIQRGWKRSFVLRPDVARSKDAAFFEALLEKINTKQFSPRKDFKEKKRRKGKKVQVERIQRLEEHYEWSFKRLKLTDKEKKYFTEVQEFQSKRCYRVKYVFNEPWRYVLKVQPNIITWIKVIDPVLQQEEAEIEKILSGRELYPKLWHLINGNYHRRNRWRPRPKEKYRSLLERGLHIELYEVFCQEMDRAHSLKNFNLIKFYKRIRLMDFQSF